jgi:hypothetical protein
LEAHGKVDLRFLDELQKPKFASRVPKLIRWYDEAFRAFKNKDDLPYRPTIFVVPFYVRVESRIDGGTMILHLIGTTSLDPDDPHDKWSIYVPYSVVKNAPRKINIASIAHEIAHFGFRAKGVEALTVKDIYQAVEEGKTSVDVYLIKEREVKNVENQFEEPIRTMILDMEQEKVKHPDTVKKYLGDTPGLTQDEFYDKILGHGAAEKFFEERFQRIKESLGRGI